MDALDTAIVAQVQLVKRLRLVRASLPKWWSALDQDVAISQDAECQRLLASANRAWKALESRKVLGICTACGTRESMPQQALCGYCDELQEAM
jgi:hypothetical protein